MEEWRIVPSAPHIEASSLGRVRFAPYFGTMPNGSRRVYGGRPLKPQHSDNGRLLVTVRSKRHKISRLVCEAFHGPPFPGAVCMHINDVPSDNRAENLRWGTQRENLNAPAFIAYCRSRTGSNNPHAKAKARRSASQSE